MKYINEVDSSYFKSIKASNEALAKYNLVLVDSMNRVTSKINVKSIDDPVLTLDSDNPIQIEIKSGWHWMHLNLTSYDAGSTNFKITCYTIFATKYEYNPEPLTTNSGNLIDTNMKLPKNSTYEIKKNMLPIPPKYEFMYVYLLGTYQNIDMTKTYHCDQMYFRNIYGKSSGMITGGTKILVQI